jgi:hypothetical protein
VDDHAASWDRVTSPAEALSKDKVPDGAAAARSAAPAPPQLAVIVPTLNERDNIAPLLARLGETLAGIEWEPVFIDDDSQDGTAEQDHVFEHDQWRYAATAA